MAPSTKHANAHFNETQNAFTTTTAIDRSTPTETANRSVSPRNEAWDKRKANPGEIEIAFGQGRSSHTNRDFIATMLWLSQFAINPFTLVFRVRDEFDGFESEGTQTVQFIERKCLVKGWMKEFAEWTA